ncbi:protein translocase subunit SecF [candidate division WWE3 bacterium CG_4_9_14_0_2_um_filter_35_11]|uniref:Protein-export membrane protein SecF n=1 Tax=candidate division WWE3 bacterium CG_4_9_14_0_2_um_filter_35_11 TaxID=1975077 RepID=A0A2M8EKX4_UNCKA|nr:MAG: protein translocase subunit SecF [candidate division WWE3 bacterium CG10_big_fil_rev_8_21_14_0_10_35_32]PJC23394.1 MAG: protein translocase subunit SecF [candidate division WWE3 bacterium CG_4_9_14_0_2_um_filter_35_11]
MINFMKFRNLYFLISGIFLLASILSLIFWGLRPAIDFTGGALLEVTIENPEKIIATDDMETFVSEVSDVKINSIQSVSDTQNYILKLNNIDEAKKTEIISKLEEQYQTVTEIRFETVGPTLGKELLVKTAAAILIAAALILLYVAYQFKSRIYGMSAILAMLHDTLILVGSFAIFGRLAGVEIDTLFVTAVLTTLSFSVHDTIVVFDRIRESLKQSPNSKPVDLVNKAVTGTLSRSINNSMTIIFMLTALSLLGGISIKWFSVALLVGTVTGTYSSTFVAVPLLLVFLRNKKTF